jgi:hypothetical protein
MEDDQGSEPVEELHLEPVATVRRQRRQALWAVLGFLGLVAGGLVVSSASDDGPDRSALPVDLASATRSGGEAAADAMLAWVVYVPGDDLPALGGEATAYRVSGDVDEAQVQQLAAALGLEGDVQHGDPSSWSVTGDGGRGRLDVYAGGGVHWSYFSGYQDCGEADGAVGGCATGECVTKGDVTQCTASGTANAAGGGAGVPGCVDTGECVPATPAFPECGAPNVDCLEATTTTASPCEAPCPIDCVPSCPPSPSGTEPGSNAGSGSGCAPDECIPPDEQARPSADLPAEADARKVALDVVAASGADVEGATVDATSSGASWHVTVKLVPRDVPAGFFSSVEIGPELQVLSAGGTLGRVEALGDYPVLDTHATIDRANEQRSSTGRDVQVGAADPSAGTTGGTDAVGTDDTPVTATIVPGTDPCAAPDGASDGCGGTTGCGGDGCAETPTTVPCKVQADGSEICENTDCGSATVEGPDAPAVDLPCAGPACPQGAPAEDAPGTASGAPTCAPPTTVPVVEPKPLEIVLVDAERSLVVLPANDGSRDAYLVPAYRFTAQDGSTIYLPAVDDEALAGPVTTETTVPDTVVPPPVPVPEPQPQPCQVLEESGPGGESATTLTVQTCPTPEDPRVLGEGEEPAIGVGYYVDVDLQCAGGSFLLGGAVWVSADDAPSGWGDGTERYEGGTFTLDAADHGTFVGDAAASKVGDFRPLKANEDLFCAPEPR